VEERDYAQLQRRRRRERGDPRRALWFGQLVNDLTGVLEQQLLARGAVPPEGPVDNRPHRVAPQPEPRWPAGSEVGALQTEIRARHKAWVVSQNAGESGTENNPAKGMPKADEGEPRARVRPEVRLHFGRQTLRECPQPVVGEEPLV